jgi:hypothetical protein
VVSPGPPISSTNKTDRHDIAEILLKVALSTVKQANKQTNKQTLVILKHCSKRNKIPLEVHRIKRNQTWQENRYIVYYLNFPCKAFSVLIFSVRNSRLPTTLDSVEICYYKKPPYLTI